MGPKKTLLYTLRVLDLTIQRTIETNAREHMYMGISAAQMMMLDYLTKHRGEDIFQRDIAQTFAIRNSSVTAVLQKMERAGLIERSGVDSDARLKKISVTEKGMNLAANCKRDMDELEERIRNILTEEEIGTFLSISDKLINAVNQGGNNDQETC